MRADPAAIASFLRLLWPEDSSGYLGLWSEAKVPNWLPAGDAPDAAPQIARAASTRDVWMHVGLAPVPMASRSRVRAEEVIAIPGLWCDLDYLDPAHKKTNLPPDEAAAHAFLAELPLRPSVVLHSGHGLQAWWLFKESWYFADEAERQHAAALARGWQGYMRGRCRAHGWDLDSTFDLARLMRIGGTLNHRRPIEGVRPVKVLQAEPAAYNPSDFDPYLGAEGDEVAITPPLRISLTETNGQLDQETLKALLDASPRFRSTWERTRKDLQDQSGSGYDQSLANQLAAAGWGEQKILAVLVESGRKHGGQLKALTYYQRTIGKALDWAAKHEEQAASVEELAVEAEAADPESRIELVQRAWAQLGIEGVTDWQLVLGKKDSYVLSLPSGNVNLGQNLYNLPIVRMHVLNRVGRGMVYVTQKDWTKHADLLRGLVAVVEAEPIGQGAQVEEWIEEFTEELPPEVDPKPEFVRVTLEERGIHIDGCLYLRPAVLKRFVDGSTGEKLDLRELQRELRLAGWEPWMIRRGEHVIRVWRQKVAPVRLTRARELRVL